MEQQSINNLINILGKDWLENLKKNIKHYPTLFSPNWEMLKQYRCPFCGNKLKLPRSKKILICSGKKHLKPFVIKDATFIDIVYKSK